MMKVESGGREVGGGGMRNVFFPETESLKSRSSLNIILTSYNRIKNVLSASLNKTFPSTL